MCFNDFVIAEQHWRTVLFRPLKIYRNLVSRLNLGRVRATKYLRFEEIEYHEH